jgi:hypothetical protein
MDIAEIFLSVGGNDLLGLAVVGSCHFIGYPTNSFREEATRGYVVSGAVWAGDSLFMGVGRI